MAPQSLPRSFKRKYKKLHSRFTSVQSSTALLEEHLKTATATALKLIADNDMLLDLLGDLAPAKSHLTVEEQFAIYEESGDAVYGANAETSEYQPQFYLQESAPEYFQSLPWDLDRNSFSGSHLEDLAKAASAAQDNAQAGSLETPGLTAGGSTRKSNNVRPPSGKKRERVDGEEDVNGSSSRKKKRKSIIVPASDTWEA